MLPSSTASAPRSVPPPASSSSPRPIASRSDSSANSAVRPANWPSAARSKSMRFADVKAVDVIGITQGPRFRGCHEAAQFLRPAGHARREEVPPRTRRHRCQRVPQPRGQRQADARPVTATSRKTVRNQKLVKVDAENNLLLVCGAVPGPERRLRRSSKRNEHGVGRRWTGRFSDSKH